MTVTNGRGKAARAHSLVLASLRCLINQLVNFFKGMVHMIIMLTSRAHIDMGEYTNPLNTGPP